MSKWEMIHCGIDDDELIELIIEDDEPEEYVPEHKASFVEIPPNLSIK